MIGTVKFYNEERRFGFVRYAPQPNLDRLDCEAYFDESSLRSFVQAGDRVTFELDEKDGRPQAIDIDIVTEDRLTGTILNTGKKPYCFIEVDGRYGDYQRVFCAFDDVIPDVLGRRALNVGTRVSFRVESGRGGIHERAVDVRNEDPSLEDIDAESYREFGKVEWYDGDRGHIRRPCGDTLAFLKKNVITDGVETIAIGTWLQYGIKRNLFMFSEELGRFRHRVFARDIAVCLADENSQPMLPIDQAPPGSAEHFFLTAPDLPLANSPAPAQPPPTTHTSVLLSPENRTKTLRQLIAEKRLAA